MIEEVQQDNYVQIMFDSVFDMIESVVEISKTIPSEETNHAKWNPGSNSKYREGDWVGRKFNSWEHAKTEANTIWHEGMRSYDNAIAQLRDEKVPQPKSLKRKGFWSEEEGDEVCMDRLQTDQPYLRHTKRQHRPGPVSMSVLTDVSTHCGMKSSEIIWRGVAAICLTEVLERAGYRVELWAVNHCASGYQNNKNHLSAVRLKHGQDPLDVSTLINATSGWYYRTFFFGGFWLYTKNEPAPNLGMPCGIASIKHLITKDEACIICEHIWNHSSAITWVRQTLENIK